MHLHVARTKPTLIQPLRALFLREANHQIRYDARHARGQADVWMLTADGRDVGYAALTHGDDDRRRDTLFEFYVVPTYRRQASSFFERLLAEAPAARVECQSNDALLSAMLFEFTRDVNADTVLFEHAETTTLGVPGASFRARRRHEPEFDGGLVPEGDYVIEIDGEVVASGGFLLHYNAPFADVYMEVGLAHRCRGVGSLLVQEVTRECLLAGRVPAARCNLRNVASRATLTRAGFRVIGHMIAGRVLRGEG